MGQFLGGCLFLIIVATVLSGWFGDTGVSYNRPYATTYSPTGYAVTRRYYDLETGDTYAATTPVRYVALDTRRPRGTINYSYNTSFPQYGVYPRSY